MSSILFLGIKRCSIKYKIMYEADFEAMAKDVLSNIKPTPYNREIIDSWREVAVSHNTEYLHDEISNIEGD